MLLKEGSAALYSASLREALNSCARATWSVLMPTYRRQLPPRRERVVAVGVAFPDTTVPAVDEQFAALIPSDLSRGIDGLVLGLMYRTGALTASPADSPPAIVRNDMLISFCHVNLLVQKELLLNHPCCRYR